MKSIPLQFAYYLLTGGISFLVDMGCFASLRHYLNANIMTANVAARFAGALSAYLLNHHWTFKSDSSRVSSFMKYAALWLFSTLVSTETVMLASHFRHGLAAEIAGKFCIEVLIVIFNFLVCKYWVFRVQP